MVKEAEMSIEQISKRTLDNFKGTVKSNVSNPMDSRSCIFITFWNNLLLLLLENGPMLLEPQEQVQFSTMQLQTATLRRKLQK